MILYSISTSVFVHLYNMAKQFTKWLVIDGMGRLNTTFHAFRDMKTNETYYTVKTHRTPEVRMRIDFATGNFRFDAAQRTNIRQRYPYLFAAEQRLSDAIMSEHE